MEPRQPRQVIGMRQRGGANNFNDREANAASEIT
jgi:hypothetical protein